MRPTTSSKAGGSSGAGKGDGWGSFAIPASPIDEVDMTDAAREGAQDGTAVGTSSVAPTTTGRGALEKTGAGSVGGGGGRLDDGEGA